MMARPWFVTAIFLFILMSGVLLSIVTIFALDQYTGHVESFSSDDRVFDWSEKLLGVCVAFAGSFAAILIAQSTLRQSENLTEFQEAMDKKERKERKAEEAKKQEELKKEKEAEKQALANAKEQEKLQLGLARWKEFLFSIEQLFATADEVASGIVKEMISTDWQGRKFDMEIDRNELRTSRKNFFQTLSALESLEKQYRPSSLWHTYFAAESPRQSSAAALLKVARKPNGTENVIGFQDLIASMKMGTVDAFNCLNAVECIVDLHGRNLRDFLYPELALLFKSVLEISLQLKGVRTRLSESCNEDSTIEANTSEREYLKEREAELREQREDLVRQLEEELDEAKGWENNEILAIKYQLGRIAGQLDEIEQDLAEASDFENELIGIIEDNREKIAALTDDVGKKLDKLRTLMPKTSGDRAYQKAVANIYIQSRRSALLLGENTTVRDEILGLIVDLMLQPDGLSVPLNEGVKEARIGLAFLVDLLRCIPEHTTEIFDHGGENGKPAKITRFKQDPVKSDIGELARTLMDKVAQHPEKFLLQIDLEHREKTNASKRKIASSKLDDFSIAVQSISKNAAVN